MPDAAPTEIRDLLDDLARRSEPWKIAHDSAMRCRDAEDATTLAIAVSLSIDLIDQNRRGAMFAGQEPFSAVEEAAIETMYRDWLKSAESIAAKLADAEAAGYTIRFAEAFRRCHREARGIFEPAAQYLDHPAMTDLRDAAIEAHRSGLTAGFQELGD